MINRITPSDRASIASLIVLSALTVVPQQALGAAPTTQFDPVEREIEGWKVHVEPALLADEQAEEGAKALAMLANHLQRIKILVPAEPLAKL